MNHREAEGLVERQRAFFLSGATRDVEWRKDALRRLRDALERHEAEMYEAVRQDMGRADVETYFMEVFQNREEIDHAIGHLSKWARARKVKTPTLFFMAQSTVHPEPYGVTLIISAWNFPLLQLFSPLVGAIAAGNTAILKPAVDAPACSRLAAKIVTETFEPQFVACIEGGVECTTALLEQKLDLIFFTGSPRVGRIIQSAAARNLTPVVLELGGKSPAIVDETADIDAAAKRIAWCKFFNAGQICVAVDHVYVHRSVEEEFIERVKHYVGEFYGDDPSRSPDFSFMINERNFDRVSALIDAGEVAFGGQRDRARRFIGPTGLRNVGEDDASMRDEVFGPVLPVLTYDRLDHLLGIQARKDKPLALYFFSSDTANQEAVISRTSSGGVTINDCMSHAGTLYLPFGGVGNSGMGVYHGKATFDAFSHAKAVLRAPTARILDVSFKYPPYAGKLAKLKKLEPFL